MMNGCHKTSKPTFLGKMLPVWADSALSIKFANLLLIKDHHTIQCIRTAFIFAVLKRWKTSLTPTRSNSCGRDLANQVVGGLTL